MQLRATDSCEHRPNTTAPEPPAALLDSRVRFVSFMTDHAMLHSIFVCPSREELQAALGQYATDALTREGLRQHEGAPCSGLRVADAAEGCHSREERLPGEVALPPLPIREAHRYAAAVRIACCRFGREARCCCCGHRLRFLHKHSLLQLWHMLCVGSIEPSQHARSVIHRGHISHRLAECPSHSSPNVPARENPP